MLWVLNLSDGHHSLLDVAERSGLDFRLIQQAAEILAESHLLKRSDATQEWNRANHEHDLL